MKALLTKAFWPILKFFETGAEPENYKPSHRTALNIISSIFIVLSLSSAWAAVNSAGLGGLFPVVAFFALGSVGLIVGILGSKKAVSRIWGTK